FKTPPREPSRSTEKKLAHFRPSPVDFCGSQAALCGRKLPLRSRRVAPPEILGQVDDVAALASAEDLQHCVELGAQLGDLLIALCQQCSDAVVDAVDEFLFGKWCGVGLRGRRAGVFLWLGGQTSSFGLGGSNQSAGRRSRSARAAAAPACSSSIRRARSPRSMVVTMWLPYLDMPARPHQPSHP